MELKVSSKSNPRLVAGSIVGNLNDGKDVEIICVGAGAINQAIKSVTIARSYTIVSAVDLLISPSFKLIEVDGREFSAINLKIVKQER